MFCNKEKSAKIPFPIVALLNRAGCKILRIKDSFKDAFQGFLLLHCHPKIYWCYAAFST